RRARGVERSAFPGPDRLGTPHQGRSSLQGVPAMTKLTEVPRVSKKPDPRKAVEEGEGVLRLAPCWVPRSFLTPGRRLKLHPDDIYALGAHRGGIDERWFSSTTAAANEGAPPDEGLSYVVQDGKRLFTLKDAIGLEGQR